MTSSDLEFTFFLATELKMTVAEIENTMSNGEFVHWTIYYAKKNQKAQLEQLKARRRG